MMRLGLLAVALPLALAGVTGWLVWLEMRDSLRGEEQALHLLRRQGWL